MPALEILQYLRSIDPEVLILNGDIVDVWQFKKKYFPAEHMQVVRELLQMIARQKKVFYITGNHDEVFRQFVGFETGNFKIVNKVILTLDGMKAWFFHGDVFDVTMQHSKWLTLLGSKGYDALIWLNHRVNRVSLAMGKGRISLSKRVKESVKSAVKFINNFEETPLNCHTQRIRLCGMRTHSPTLQAPHSSRWGAGALPQQRRLGGNCTALEYNRGGWHIHWQDEVPAAEASKIRVPLKTEELFKELLVEFAVVSALRDLCTMDSLSQIVLGAAVGEAVLGRSWATAPWSGALWRAPCLTWMSRSDSS